MAAEHGTQFVVDSVEGASDVHISATGELDVATAPKLEEAIIGAVRMGKGVSLDLSGIDFLDSTGLRAVLGGLRRARAAEVHFSLDQTSPAVDRLLRVTGLVGEF